MFFNELEFVFIRTNKSLFLFKQTRVCFYLNKLFKNWFIKFFEQTIYWTNELSKQTISLHDWYNFGIILNNILFSQLPSKDNVLGVYILKNWTSTAYLFSLRASISKKIFISSKVKESFSAFLNTLYTAHKGQQRSLIIFVLSSRLKKSLANSSNIAMISPRKSSCGISFVILKFRIWSCLFIHLWYCFQSYLIKLSLILKINFLKANWWSNSSLDMFSLSSNEPLP